MTTTNTLVSLEEVRKIYNRNRYSQKISEWYTESCPNIIVDVIKLNAIEEIESLPTINPIAIIDKMIEEIDNNNSLLTAFALGMQKWILKELKSRLTNL